MWVIGYHQCVVDMRIPGMVQAIDILLLSVEKAIYFSNATVCLACHQLSP